VVGFEKKMSDFATFFLNGKRKREEEDDEDDENECKLTPVERGIFMDLKLKYRNNSKAQKLFSLAPNDLNDKKARQVLVAIQDLHIKEIMLEKAHFDAMSSQIDLLDAENRGLRRTNEQLLAANERLSPIESILQDAKAMQDLVFKQSATEKELREKLQMMERRLLKASSEWNEYYRGEKNKMRNVAIDELEEHHWTFIDYIDSRTDVPPDLRDAIIEFMGRTRLVLNKL